MTQDQQINWQGLCQELLQLDAEQPTEYADWKQRWNAAIKRARAALAAEAEPEAVGELTDQELLRCAKIATPCYDLEAWERELRMMRAAIAADRARHCQPAPPAAGEVGELVAWLRDRAESTSLAHNALRITRAADLLERHPAPVPALAGELLKEAAWLRNECSAENADGNWISMSIDQALDLASLLERQAAPVPMAVSERLPGAEERDSDECCWWFYPETDDTLPVWALGYGNDAWEIEKPPSPTHWLPAHTLPLPQGEVEE